MSICSKPSLTLNCPPWWKRRTGNFLHHEAEYLYEDKSTTDEQSNSSTFLENSSSAGDLYSISQPEMTSGSVVSDFLSPSESTSLSLEEGDCSPLQLAQTQKKNASQQPNSRKEFHRSASADHHHYHSNSRPWTDSGSARTLPERSDENKPATTIFDINTNGGSIKLKLNSKAGNAKTFVEEVEEKLLPNGTPEQRIQALEMELKKAREVIVEKEQKCAHLMKLQNAVDSEVQDLTETLFQEAYKMVNTADEKRDRSERLLVEAKMKLDLLQAEVGALKTIVKTSTPKKSSKTNITQRFLNTSIGNRTPESQSTPSKKSNNFFSSPKSTPKIAISRPSNVNEVDPIYYKAGYMARKRSWFG
uniref:GDP/GTP exchange factor Sec2 N-terminal domain-containing protein n=1 Tax=Ditylenchus dipsaci TaxID=166011 RepID=A0A915E2U2_9BILA